MKLSSFVRAFRAERIKQRRTSLWWTAGVVFPVLTAALPVSFVLMVSTPLKPEASAGAAEGVLMFWARFFLPLFTVLVAFALQTSEHNAGMWKHLNAMPTRGPAQILAKYAVGGLAVFVATCALIPVTAICEGIGHLVRSDFTFAAGWPWAMFAQAWALNLLAGIGMVVVMIAIAGRARRSAIGMTLGLGALFTVTGNMALQCAGYAPWTIGWVWSYMIMKERAASSSIVLLLVTTPLWILATLVVQVRLERARPLY